MRRRTAIAVAAIAGAMVGGCVESESPSDLSAGLSPEAAEYLDAALDLMEANSFRRADLDWSYLRAEVVRRAGPARTREEVYPAIEFALEQLGGRHSFFLPPDSADDEDWTPPNPWGQRLSSRLAYLALPTYLSADAAGDATARRFHEIIANLDAPEVCGWVVDLRGSAAADPWPLLAGIGPLAGEGVLGFFVGPDSLVETWTYEGGAALLDGEVRARSDPAYTLLSPDPAVVVLASGSTAIAGEAGLVAFKGRENTRSLGGRTYGASADHRTYTLEDGARLVLAVSAMADRTGRDYGRPITVDFAVGGRATGDPRTDATISMAVDWLQTHQRCRD